MADTDVSVIIPAYNASRYIGRAVESVKKQTGLTWEIIIVENGSTDDTYDKCLEYANADDRIKVMQSNKGVSNARNKGLDNASGKWICFLDADDYLYDGAFQYISGISQAYETKCVFSDITVVRVKLTGKLLHIKMRISIWISDAVC